VTGLTALAEVTDISIIVAAIKARAGYIATYDRKHLVVIKDQIRDSLGVRAATPQEILAF